jgi:hypothetical protein
MNRLADLPHRCIRLLALYFGVSGTDRTNIYELVDGLVNANHFSKVFTTTNSYNNAPIYTVSGCSHGI